MSLPNSPVKFESGRATPVVQRGSRMRWRQLGALFPPPLQIALVVFSLAWVLAWVRGPLTLNIGANDSIDLLYLTPGEDGFFAAETRPPNPEFPQADNTYRWAGRKSRIKLFWPLDAVPLKAYVRMTAPRPGLEANRTGAMVKVREKLEWADQELGTVAVNGEYQGNYYLFKLPPHLRPNLASYEINLEADNAYQPAKGDVRGLSLLFFGLRLEPDWAEFGVQGWLASFARPGLLALMALCCWGISRSFFSVRLRGPCALVSEGVAGGLLLLSLVGWPLLAEPLYAAWAFILPVGWLLLSLAEMFRRRATSLPAPFIYAATLFPLLPLAQFAFGRLDLYSLNPSSVLIGAYTAALFYAGANYINTSKEGPAAFERAFVRGMLVAAFVAFAYNHFFVFQNNLYRGADFKVYYSALLRFEGGGPLYDLGEVLNQPGQAARMPPGFTFLLWPFARIFGGDTNAALLGWRLASEFLLIPCLLILVRCWGGVRDGLKMTPAVLFLAFNFEQVSESLGYGQWNIVVLLGLSLMSLWIKEGRMTRAGAALALPVGLKLYPVVSALYFLTDNTRLRRGWRGLLGLVAGGLVIIGLAALVVGGGPLWFYASQVVFGVNRPEIDISNQSLWGFWGRLSVTQVMADFKGDLPGWVNFVSYACVLGVTALTGWVLWRRRGGSWQAQGLGLSALVFLGVLIPPFVWLHYIVPCLVGVLALFNSLSRPANAEGQAVPRWQLAAFALAYAMLAYGGRNDFFFTQAVGLARFGSSYRFLAALGLWALSLWLLWQPARSEKSVEV